MLEQHRIDEHIDHFYKTKSMGAFHDGRRIHIIDPGQFPTIQEFRSQVIQLHLQRVGFSSDHARLLISIRTDLNVSEWIDAAEWIARGHFAGELERLEAMYRSIARIRHEGTTLGRPPDVHAGPHYVGIAPEASWPKDFGNTGGTVKITPAGVEAAAAPAADSIAALLLKHRQTVYLCPFAADVAAMRHAAIR